MCLSLSEIDCCICFAVLKLCAARQVQQTADAAAAAMEAAVCAAEAGTITGPEHFSPAEAVSAIAGDVHRVLVSAAKAAQKLSQCCQYVLHGTDLHFV